jgi:hypothetical protein
MERKPNVHALLLYQFELKPAIFGMHYGVTTHGL